MHSQRIRLTGAFVALCATAACLCATATAASADVTSAYPPGSQSRDFAGGEGGWESSTEQEGVLGGALCIPPVTCPAITNSYQATGGVDGSGDGFIETSEGGLSGVGALGAAVSSGIYESPAFTYEGAAGQTPTKVELGIARRAAVAGLLAVSGATATYGVELVDESSASGNVIVIPSSSLKGAPEEWKSLSASIAPSALTPGHSYKVRIKTTFDTPALALPSGGVGYDDVVVTATKVEAANGGNGGNGSSGSNGANGGGGNGPHVSIGVRIVHGPLSAGKIARIARSVKLGAEVGHGPGGSLIPLSECTIIGTPHRDVITATRGNDVICGLGGRDVIRGRGGRDVIDGGNGNDVMVGSRGADVLIGLRGRDTERGDSGNDRLGGGAQGDRLFGGSGSDLLIGRRGVNRLYGGAGSDRLIARNRRRDVVRGGAGRDVAHITRLDRKSVRGARVRMH